MAVDDKAAETGSRRAARTALWNDPRARALITQVLVLAAFVALVWWFIDNTLANLASLGIASGFGFLKSTSGFNILFHLVPYSAVSTYGQAFLVGLLNTLLVSSLGIVFATILGFTIGVLRLSPNWLVARLAGVYIEVVRNIPLLLQIFVWYFAVLGTMPHPRQAISLFDMFFLTNRGLYSPAPVFESGFWTIPVAFGIAIVAVVLLVRWAGRRQDATGYRFPTLYRSLALLIGLPLLAALVTGLPLSWTYPELTGFNFSGGLTLVPEFVALLTALTIYTAAFIAEIVRAGILSVSKGQTEAAYALGLSPARTLRLVIIPQAMRVIVPPLTSQYLSLTKNSSLAAAIGYPELVSVFAGTVLNQTGQAIEVIAITMAVYLTISLTISLLMNLYNRRIALVER